jgi:hypothetical protein
VRSWSFSSDAALTTPSPSSYVVMVTNHPYSNRACKKRCQIVMKRKTTYQTLYRLSILTSDSVFSLNFFMYQLVLEKTLEPTSHNISIAAS